ncbi:glutamate-5-semialdehyde dehydrogenase [Alloiococcus sp. CFN-8]|uniref:glutamate-5-semialdehyde dehydrogenase n=1 Tax=Alloiococcus sp. CFN-8 TaxID=3416081 RepID=UPI003CF532D0
MDELLIKAKAVKNSLMELLQLTEEEKNTALLKVAEVLEENKGYILEANSKDVEAAIRRGESKAIIDRLTLNEERINSMAQGVRDVSSLKDPIGEVIETIHRPNGLTINKVRVPFGIIGIIYEGRPNVTVDCFALALKSGNGAILRGSSSALNSNMALVSLIKKALEETSVPASSIELIESPDRELVNRLLKLKDYVDVIIPRGGAGLINAVVNNSTIPVLETGVGNCHIYLDASASYSMSLKIVLNAKTQRPGVCNAAEKLLVHKDFAEKHLHSLLMPLVSSGVELRGCPEARRICPSLLPAKAEDWDKEYLDLIMSVKVVNSLEEAIHHINSHSTKHTEAIITESKDNADIFLSLIDAAVVVHNASTRFTDGGEFGFGAEIGISTQKLHARGPMGLKELTTYKYKLLGNGQTRI